MAKIKLKFSEEQLEEFIKTILLVPKNWRYRTMLSQLEIEPKISEKHSREAFRLILLNNIADWIEIHKRAYTGGN